MDQAAIDRLRSIPRTRCTVCNSGRAYTNPMAKCHECKKKFCYDHVFGGQVNEQMKLEDVVRDVCKDCKDQHCYRGIAEIANTCMPKTALTAKKV